jgi:hypothetical protein
MSSDIGPGDKVSFLYFTGKKIIVVEGRVDKTTDELVYVGNEFEDIFHVNTPNEIKIFNTKKYDRSRIHDLTIV